MIVALFTPEVVVLQCSSTLEGKQTKPSSKFVTKAIVILHINRKDPSKFRSDIRVRKNYMKLFFHVLLKRLFRLDTVKSQTSQNLFLTLERIS